MWAYLRWGLVVLVGGAYFTARMAQAAPFVVPRSPISDEVRSLERVEKVKLILSPFPESLIKAGITPAKVRSQWEKKLQQSGLILGGDEDVMNLSLVLIVTEHPSIADGIGFCNFLMLEQPVRIKRLKEDLFIPTWTGISSGIRSRKALVKGINVELDALLGQFLTRIQLAREWR